MTWSSHVSPSLCSSQPFAQVLGWFACTYGGSSLRAVGAWHVRSFQELPCGPCPAWPDPQGLAFWVSVEAEGGTGGGVWCEPPSWLRGQVSPAVQCELLVPVSSFMQLLILVLNKVPLFLDVVMRVVFAIIGKAEKNGSWRQSCLYIPNLRNVSALEKHYKEFNFSGCVWILVLQEVFYLSVFRQFPFSMYCLDNKSYQNCYK